MGVHFHQSISGCSNRQPQALRANTQMVMVEESISRNSRVSRDVAFSNRNAEIRRVRMRPITPDDDMREEHFVANMDERSHAMRFFGPKRVHPTKELLELTHVDYRDDLALCCVDQDSDEFVAVARYYSLSHDPKASNHNIVEVAVVVDDKWSGFGIGVYMVYHLLSMAAHEGKVMAVAEVLQENNGACHLFKKFLKLVPSSTQTVCEGVVEFKIPLTLHSDAESLKHGPYINISYDELVGVGQAHNV